MSELNPTQKARVERWGVMYRGVYRKALIGTASPRAAIKAQCLDCTGEDRIAITECGDRCCPLWQYRPFQLKSQSKAVTSAGASEISSQDAPTAVSQDDTASRNTLSGTE